MCQTFGSQEARGGQLHMTMAGTCAPSKEGRRARGDGQQQIISLFKLLKVDDDGIDHGGFLSQVWRTLD